MTNVNKEAREVRSLSGSKISRDLPAESTDAHTSVACMMEGVRVWWDLTCVHRDLVDSTQLAQPGRRI